MIQSTYQKEETLCLQQYVNLRKKSNSEMKKRKKKRALIEIYYFYGCASCTRYDNHTLCTESHPQASACSPAHNLQTPKKTNQNPSL